MESYMNNILKIMKRSFLLLVLAICTIALIGCDNEGTGNKIPDDEYTIHMVINLLKKIYLYSGGVR